MEVNFCEERIIELQAAYSDEQVQESALARRVEVFGQMARLFQPAYRDSPQWQRQ